MKQSNLLSILILLFSLLSVQYVVATEKTADQFISTTYPYTISYSGYTSKINITRDNLNVNLKYPCNYLTFTGVCNTSYDNKIKVDGYIEKKWLYQFESEKWTDGWGEGTKGAKGDIDPNATAIAFVKTGGTATVMVKDPIFTIAPHIRLSYPTTSTYNFNTTEINTSAEPLTVEFNSFLTKGNLIVETSNDQFLIDGSQTRKIIASGTNILKKIGEINDNYKFTIVFHPTSKNTNHQATITIYDSQDANNKYTFTVTGEGIKKTPTIKWVDNKQIIYGTTLENAATSDCGTAITYTSEIGRAHV